MLFRFARAGVAGVLLSLVVAATATAHLSPMPSVCTGEPNPGCIEKGGGGNVTVSPTLAHVGDVLTIKLFSIQGQYGGVVSWDISSRATGPSSSSPSLKLLGCKPTSPRELGDGVAYCRYRVLSSGRGWQAGVATFQVQYGGLPSFSEAAWRVVPKGSYVEGYVRGRPRHKGDEGIGLSGVQVVARGKSTDSTKTNNQGYYVLQLAKPGRYEVFPKRRASDNRLRPLPRFDPDSRKVRLDSNRIKDADFRLNRGDDIRVSYTDAAGKKITDLPADGVSAATVLIEAVDANDQPISGSSGALDVIVDDFKLASKAILCSPNNARIWPGASVGGTPSAQVDTSDPSATQPDAHGQLKLALYAGTEAGSVTITARAHGAAAADPGTSATLALSAVRGPDTLAEAAQFARTNYQTGYPDAQPLDHSSESSWWQSDLYYLADAKTHGYWKGWEYLPLITTSGPTRYGIYFYKNGNQGQGGVLETTNVGLRTLENGNPLPSVGAWANGQPYQVQLLQSGYPGDGLFYNCWPYERGPADTCIRHGPA
jgi:hypothetical protein